MPDLLAQGSDLVASGFDNAQIAKLPAPFANPLVRECLPDGVQESVWRGALYHVPKDAFLLHRRPGHGVVVEGMDDELRPGSEPLDLLDGFEPRPPQGAASP